MRLFLTTFFLFFFMAAPRGQVPERGTVTDNEGNVYPTVTIGSMVWMAANLRTTVYSDGMAIAFVPGDAAWTGLTGGAFCRYNNDTVTGTCGLLYNWYAVATGKLCPAGWRVPGDDDWKRLEGAVDSLYATYDTIWEQRGLRGSDVATRLRSDTGWAYGRNGSDRYGFDALPCGERLSRNGRYFIRGNNGFWWTSTPHGNHDAFYRSMIYAFDELMRNTHDRRFGFSVRCIRDR